LGNDVNRPTFTKLEQAIAFLTRAVEANAFEDIADACEHVDEPALASGLPSTRDYRLHAAKELGRQHTMHSLPVLYAGKDFPAGKTEMRLGGHARELGHLHVVFESGQRGWQLKTLFMCR
jgi:hypothetical protein